MEKTRESSPRYSQLIVDMKLDEFEKLAPTNNWSTHTHTGHSHHTERGNWNKRKQKLTDLSSTSSFGSIDIFDVVRHIDSFSFAHSTQSIDSAASAHYF